MKKLLFLILIMPGFIFGQAGLTSFVTGQIIDGVTSEPVDLVTVYILNSSRAVESSINGRYQIIVPSEESFTLVFSRIGYKEARVKISPMPAGTNKQVDISLASTSMDIEVIVKESKLQQGGMITYRFGSFGGNGWRIKCSIQRTRR